MEKKYVKRGPCDDQIPTHGNLEPVCIQIRHNQIEQDIQTMEKLEFAFTGYRNR